MRRGPSRMTPKIFVLLLLLAATRSRAQFGMPPKPRSSPIKGDMEAIKCGVCEALAEQLYARVTTMREEAIGGKIHEDDIAAEIEGACNPTAALGKWIADFDLVEVPLKNGKNSKTLELQKPGGTGHCKEECETIARVGE
ncbi:unnamed protein product [Choristocarpus tenellus]